MAQILFANNASSTLAGPLTSTATTLNVAAGTGVLFPQPGANQFFCLTLTDAATSLLTEILHVVAVAGDTFTIQRGQENTSPQSWVAGDSADNLITAGTLQAFAQSAALGSGAFQGTDTGTNANAVVVSSTTPSLSAPVAGQYFNIVKSNKSNTGPVTCTVGSGGSAASVVYKDGTALGPSDWPANAAAILYFTGGVFQFLACQVAPAIRAYPGVDTGTADAMTVTPTPPVPALTDAVEVHFVKSGNANATTAPTLKISQQSAAPVVRSDGTALAAGDLAANALVSVKYDSTLSAFRVLGIVASQIAATPNPKNTQVSTNTNAALSMQGGSQNLTTGQPNTVQWATNVVPATVGTYANGSLKVTRPGWYEIVAQVVITGNSSHSSYDALSMTSAVTFTASGASSAYGSTNDLRSTPIAPSGGMNPGTASIVAIVATGPIYINQNDGVSLVLTPNNFFGDATNIVLQGTTNMKVQFLNP